WPHGLDIRRTLRLLAAYELSWPVNSRWPYVEGQIYGSVKERSCPGSRQEHANRTREQHRRNGDGGKQFHHIRHCRTDSGSDRRTGCEGPVHCLCTHRRSIQEASLRGIRCPAQGRSEAEGRSELSRGRRLLHGKGREI